MKLARAFATVVLLAFSCDYGDTTKATPPASAVEACELGCARVEALKCSAPLPGALTQTCAECDALKSDAASVPEACGPLLQIYYECLAKQGNARCGGYLDDCAHRRDVKDACLDGLPPPSGACPDDFPIDCGTSFCCPLSHPVCRSGGLCAASSAVDAGAAGAAGAGG
jgi:hypothetical protein